MYIGFARCLPQVRYTYETSLPQLTKLATTQRMTNSKKDYFNITDRAD